MTGNLDESTVLCLSQGNGENQLRIIMIKCGFLYGDLTTGEIFKN